MGTSSSAFQRQQLFFVLERIVSFTVSPLPRRRYYIFVMIEWAPRQPQSSGPADGRREYRISPAHANFRPVAEGINPARPHITVAAA